MLIDARRRPASLRWPRPSKSFLLASAIAFGPLALLALAVLASAGYQRWADHRDAARFAPPGRLVDVGGHRLHLSCSGRGAPTVVLDAPVGSASVYWLAVMPLVAADARVCAYDRAGLGWSETSDTPRTASQMARELHALLANAGERGPYALVGSGLGGYVVRIYASRFGSEVAGVALVDTLWEERSPQSDQSAALVHTIGWAGTLGIVRAKAELTNSGWLRPRPYPPELWPVVSALAMRTEAFSTAGREWDAQDESAAQVRASRGAFPDVRLVVLTPGPPRSEQQLPLWHYWRDAHARIAQTSPRGRHMIADYGDAPFAFTHPDLVARTVGELIEAGPRT